MIRVGQLMTELEYAMRQTRGSHAEPAALRLLTIAVLIVLGAHGVQAQSLIDRAKRAAGKTTIGKKVDAAGLEVDMLEAVYVDLEGAGLSQVSVGQLAFGLSGIDIANGKGVRLHAYLFNPSAQDQVVPVPDAGLFRLVDDRGRTMELASGPSVDAEDASVGVTVPALERLTMSMLFGDAPDEPSVATLKVGNLGMIAGIPVHTQSAAEVASDAQNVWSGERPAAASPWQAPPTSQPGYPPPPPSQAVSPPVPTSSRPGTPQPVSTPGAPSTPPPLPPVVPSQGAPRVAPPPAAAAPADDALSGSNGIVYEMTGALSVRGSDTGTVTCTSGSDGRFTLQSTGSWTVEVGALAPQLGRYEGTVSLWSGTQAVTGTGFVQLLSLTPGLAGRSLLKGRVDPGNATMVGGAVAVTLQFVCQL